MQGDAEREGERRVAVPKIVESQGGSLCRRTKRENASPISTIEIVRKDQHRFDGKFEQNQSLTTLCETLAKPSHFEQCHQLLRGRRRRGRVLPGNEIAIGNGKRCKVASLLVAPAIGFEHLFD